MINDILTLDKRLNYAFRIGSICQKILVEENYVLPNNNNVRLLFISGNEVEANKLLSNILDINIEKNQRRFFYIPLHIERLGDMLNSHLIYNIFKKLNELNAFDNIENKKVLVIQEPTMYFYACQIFGKKNVVFLTFDKAFATHLEQYKSSDIQSMYIDKVEDIETALEIYDMKDIHFIFTNSPYSKKEYGKTEGGKYVNIWKEVTNRCLKIIQTNGHLAMIHPGGWRDNGKKSKEIFDELTNNQMLYLEMHNVEDGKKVFGASTSYDWYIVKKTENTKQTIVVDTDGNENKVDLKQIKFLPSGKIDLIYSLVAKEGEEKVELLFDRKKYGTDNDSNTSKEKSEEFKYPCIYNIQKGGELEFYYSSINKGHFETPKLIIHFGSGRNFFLDEKGEYGMTQYACGIVDTIDNLKKIKECFENSEFQNILDMIITSTYADFNKNIFQHFRKDFWKSFV